MKEQGERPDHCLVGEPTNAKRIGEAIKIGRRGSLNGRLKVTGMQGHVAYPHLASNPIKGLMQMLARLYDFPLDYGSAHFSPSNLEVTSIDVGNPTVNVIPAFAEAKFNVRFNDRHSAKTLKALLPNRPRSRSAGTDLGFTLDFEPPSHSFLTEPGPLDALLSEAVREVTGLTPSLATDGGTSDARFIKDIARWSSSGCPPPRSTRSTSTCRRRSRAADRRLSALHRALFRRPSGSRCRVIPGRSGSSTPAWAG